MMPPPKNKDVSSELKEVLTSGLVAFERGDGGMHIQINRRDARYRNRKYKELNSFERRKYENLIFIAYSEHIPTFSYT
jgi:hypothetical protein